MRGFLIILVAGVLVSGCVTTDSIRISEKGVWIATEKVSYARLWKAANTVMARRLKITEADVETGTIEGVDAKNSLTWDEAVGLLIWPTENSDAGYTVDVDSMVRIMFLHPKTDWRKVIIGDLKKELGVS